MMIVVATVIVILMIVMIVMIIMELAYFSGEKQLQTSLQDNALMFNVLSAVKAGTKTKLKPMLDIVAMTKKSSSTVKSAPKK